MCENSFSSEGPEADVQTGLCAHCYSRIALGGSGDWVTNEAVVTDWPFPATMLNMLTRKPPLIHEHRGQNHCRSLDMVSLRHGDVEASRANLASEVVSDGPQIRS